MIAIGLLRRLGPSDIRNLVRDQLLLSSLALPIAVALLLRIAVPALGTSLSQRVGFDLTTYYPLVAGAYGLVAPAVVGFVCGFMWLDERDDRVLDALRVTPVSLTSLLIYRLASAMVIGYLMTLAGYGLLGFIRLPLWSLIVSAALAAWTAPVLAMFLAAFAADKVAGFALAKLFMALSNVALVAWFITMPWQVLAGVTPSYWPMKVIWQVEADAPWLGYALAGMAFNVGAALLLLRRLRLVLSR